MRRLARGAAAGALLALVATPSMGAEATGWFQYRGPTRDGRSAETGLVRSWGESGPRELWRVPIGPGFSAVSVVSGRLYTMDSDADTEYAVCLDAASGAELWRVGVGSLFTEGYGDGPRSTPTVVGDRVYALGSRGRLVALATSDGRELWRVELAERFGAELPTWAFTSAPLIDGERLLIEAGGSEGRALAALDKTSGATLWATRADQIVYSSPIAIDFGGLRQYVFMTKQSVVGLDADGREVWSFPFAPDGTIKPAPPVFVEPDLVFVSASYGIGARVARLRARDGEISAEVVWEGRHMRNHFNGSIGIPGGLCGFDTSTLKCLDPATGDVRWAKRGLGKGSLIAADGMLIVLSERGTLVLAEETADEYRELARHPVLEGRCWTQPSLWEGRLYLRNGEELVALDLDGSGERR